MDSNQEFYLNKYQDELNQAYDNLHNAKVDYDTYKPIAESSLNKANNAKRLLDDLSETYIYYPDFLGSLNYLYLNSKYKSDSDQIILKEKASILELFQNKYNSLVTRLNSLQVQIYEEELASEIQGLLDIPENLIYSDELLKAKEIEEQLLKESIIANNLLADAAAREKIGVTLAKNPSGPEVREVCLDSMGNEIPMSICKPSSGGGGGGGGGVQAPPTAAELVNRSIQTWLDSFKVPEVKKPTPPPTTTANENVEAKLTEVKVPIPEVKQTELAVMDAIKAPIEEIKEPVKEEIKEIEPEDYINSFVFNVDLSKLKTNKPDTIKTDISDISSDVILIDSGLTLTDLGLGGIVSNDVNVVLPNDVSVTPPLSNDVSVTPDAIIPDVSGTITDVFTAETPNVIIGQDIKYPPYNPIIVPDSTNNSRLVFGAAVLGVIVAYNLIKKKD
jgi:hypothetical protein